MMATEKKKRISFHLFYFGRFGDETRKLVPATVAVLVATTTFSIRLGFVGEKQNS